MGITQPSPGHRYPRTHRIGPEKLDRYQYTENNGNQDCDQRSKAMGKDQLRIYQLIWPVADFPGIV